MLLLLGFDVHLEGARLHVLAIGLPVTGFSYNPVKTILGNTCVASAAI